MKQPRTPHKLQSFIDGTHPPGTCAIVHRPASPSGCEGVGSAGRAGLLGNTVHPTTAPPPANAACWRMPPPSAAARQPGPAPGQLEHTRAGHRGQGKPSLQPIRTSIAGGAQSLRPSASTLLIQSAIAGPPSNAASTVQPRPAAWRPRRQSAGRGAAGRHPGSSQPSVPRLRLFKVRGTWACNDIPQRPRDQSPAGSRAGPRPAAGGPTTCISSSLRSTPLLRGRLLCSLVLHAAAHPWRVGGGGVGTHCAAAGRAGCTAAWHRRPAATSRPMRPHAGQPCPPLPHAPSAPPPRCAHPTSAWVQERQQAEQDCGQEDQAQVCA